VDHLAALGRSRRLCPLLLILFCLAGCAGVAPRNPVPDALVGRAQIPGITNARIWGDDIPPEYEQRLRSLSTAEGKRAYPAMFVPEHNYLAVSGGGQDGAFGAGLLVGWTEAGNRPEFQMVTGVSTGALIAPWAFLGPDYDGVLREVYTTTRSEDIARRRRLAVVVFSDAAADSTPLRELIERHVTDQVMSAVAAEYRRGRQLFIGTTDLDFMRPVIWNVGAISASGHPNAKSLVQQIMLASASIPGALPPVRITVEVDGEMYDELHVDGGTTSQVFVYPTAMDWSELLKATGVIEGANTYIIRNSRLAPRREVVEPEILPIASRSIFTLIRTQGVGDLYRIYAVTRRDGGRYHLAYVPDDFDEMENEPFDPEYMGKLFDRGYNMARNGYPWDDTPPGWEE
jgi:hypothetical protein